ncbi:MAG: Gx transporter family protein [Candidatus Bipolaricaulia bacterium]
MNDLRRVTTFAVLLALGVALWVLETLLPPLLPLPGAKLGLSNIVVLFTMLSLGLWEGIYLAILRSLLGSLIGGTFLSVGFFLSFGGAVASALAMALCLRFFGRIFSLIGISIVGAVVHNMVQLLLVYYLFVRQPGILYYLPFLLWAGLLSGAVTGAILIYLQRRLALTGDFWDTNIEWN